MSGTIVNLAEAAGIEVMRKPYLSFAVQETKYIGFVEEQLFKIIYASVEDFDRIFAEFDKILAGAPSMLTDLQDLYNNKYSYVFRQHLKKFKQVFRWVMQKEKLKYNTREKREARIASQLQRVPEIRQVVPQRVFPNKEDMQMMDRYDLSHTMRKPEFEFYIKIQATMKDIEADSPTDQIQESISSIYSVINYATEAKDASTHKTILAAIAEAIRSLKITIVQLQEMPQDLKKFLFGNINTVIFDTCIDYSSIDLGTNSSSEKNFLIYLRCRQLLNRIAPNTNYSLRELICWSKVYSDETKLNPELRAEIISFFATALGINIAHETDGNIYIKLACLLNYLVLLTLRYDINPTELFTFEDSAFMSILHYNKFATCTERWSIDPMCLLKLPAVFLEFALENQSTCEELCTLEGLKPCEFFSLSIEEIRRCLLFQMLYSEQLDYASIQAQFAVCEVQCCNQSGLSAYAIALQKNDVKLIEIITNSIQARSKLYINTFLMRNGFVPMKDDGTLLPWYTSSCAFNTYGMLNARNQRGNTPLLEAIVQQDILAVLALICYGANIHATDSNGLTALELAQKNGNRQIINDLHETYRHLNRFQLCLSTTTHSLA